MTDHRSRTGAPPATWAAMGMVRLLAVTAFLVIVTMASSARADDARAVIEAFHRDLLAAWQTSDTTTPKQRSVALATPVASTFDAGTMIRIATGSAWRQASEQEKAALVDAFSRYMASTYASRFKGYDGQRFETTGERTGADGGIVVETKLLLGDSKKKDVSLDYVMVDTDGRWRVVDVIADGVSELALVRADYRSTLKQGGPTALVEALNSLSDQALDPS